MATPPLLEVNIPVTTLAGRRFAVRVPPNASTYTLAQEIGSEMGASVCCLTLAFTELERNSDAPQALGMILRMAHVASNNWRQGNAITAIVTSPSCPRMLECERFSRAADEAIQTEMRCVVCGRRSPRAPS